MNRRVAVTGLGAMAATGPDVAALWRGLTVPGPGAIAAHGPDGWPQARVQGFDPAAHFSDRELPMLDRVAQFSLVAARQAMHQAGLQRPPDADIDPARSGAIFGAALGHHTLDDGYQDFYGAAKKRLHPFLVPRGMPSAPCSQLSMAYGLQGPSFATASACASSAHAIGLAFQCIRSGMLDFALTGGAEASLVPGMLKAWEGLRVMSRDTCRPFSRDRAGLVLGEGAAVLVLEEWQQALRRGAVPLAEVLGFGMSADAADITAPASGGAARAMQAALADAALPPSAVGYVNAHGTGTRLNDRSEAAALLQVFGARLPGLPVSSCKGHIGHTLNAAGALEAVATVLALQHALLPPTANFREPDPECPLDCIPGAPRAQRVQVALSNSFAFGGLNAVLVLGRAQP
jgi:nodulation protein E